MIDALPHSLLLPLGEIIEDDAVGWKLVRQPSPRAALANEIEDPIENVSLFVARRSSKLASRWKQFAYDVPLLFFQITGVRFVLCHPKLSILDGCFCTAKSSGACCFLANRTY